MNGNSIKTSDSHPLQIGAINLSPHDHATGVIGLTFCPGKVQLGALTGNWQRDLATDLQAIKGWGAAAIVTLMSQEELDAAQVGNLGDACEALGMEWYHLPLARAGEFDDSFEQRWLYTSLRLRHHLRLNRHVLIHCRSGLGRTATVAGRLLLDLKWDVQRAVKAILSARPDAIAARELAKHLEKETWFHYKDHDDAFIERMLGLLLGGAVGDALGYPVEFDSLQAIRKKFGPKGVVAPVQANGKFIVSDDTQMSLFTVEGAMRGVDDSGKWSLETVSEGCRNAYQAWLSTQTGSHDHDREWELARPASMRHRRAPGNTCLGALRQGGHGTVSSPGNDSKGCGAVMRTAALGLLPNVDRNPAHRVGEAVGAITHGHVDGWLPAGAIAGLVSLLAKGETFGHALATVTGHLKTFPSGEIARTHGTYRKLVLASSLAETMRSRPTEAIRLIGEGWTGDEALAAGVYAVLTGKGFRDVIRRAANHDGDSDSTASIAGQLYGAWKGVFSIPHAWIRRLDVLDEILLITGRWLAWIPSTAAPTTRSTNAGYRQAKEYIVNVLEMVSVLHSRGYQLLRISPGLSGSGCYFRVLVTFAENIEAGNGALIVDHDSEVARHTSGYDDCYFGWTDAAGDSPDELADKFLDRFPALAAAGKGRDWIYAGWYAEMIGLARQGLIPNAYFDYYYEPPRGTMHALDQMDDGPRVPAPPGGHAPKRPTREDDLDPDEEELMDIFEDGDEDDEVDSLQAVRDPSQKNMPVPFSSFDIGLEQDRMAALRTFFMLGLEHLIPFTQQLWEQLNEPKAERARLIAQAAGIDGSGKLGLRKVLEVFYVEASEAREAAAKQYANEKVYGQDSPLDGFAEKLEAMLTRVTEAIAGKYSAVLAGEQPGDAGTGSTSVIHGPWPASAVPGPDNAPFN